MELFRELAEDVAKCNVCANMLVNPHSVNSECLENDDHGLDTDTPYVNLWNLWQGDLDADIMVIGQDFGQKEDSDSFIDVWKNGTYTNATDVALRHLFSSAFGIDIDHSEVPLFFTNMANCYRKQKTTGGIHNGWLPICVHKYMARLINIVRPKVVIVLGQVAFEALFCMDGLTVKCLNQDKASADKFSEKMQYSFWIQLGDEETRVFPVYHPGANSKRNRTLAEQEQDWIRIAEYYDTVK